jgi:hypothetical protein
MPGQLEAIQTLHANAPTTAHANALSSVCERLSFVTWKSVGSVECVERVAAMLSKTLLDVKCDERVRWASPA